MPKKLENGLWYPTANAHLIPMYYFLPKSFLQHPGIDETIIPRNPQKIQQNKSVCEFIESDVFRLLMVDAVAYVVWPYMGFTEYMEIYSGYDPAWKLAHQPELWVEEFTRMGILPTTENLLANCYTEQGYLTDWEYVYFLSRAVPSAMKRYKMDVTIQAAREMPCFEDYDYRESKQKIDFYRQWYHTRTKHPTISLEAFQEDYAASHNGQQWDMADDSQDLELYTTSQIAVDEFMATIGEVDKQILEMRLEGKTLDEIAAALGYKTHSAVLKRIRKVGLKYQKFSGMDLGFDES